MYRQTNNKYRSHVQPAKYKKTCIHKQTTNTDQRTQPAKYKKKCTNKQTNKNKQQVQVRASGQPRKKKTVTNKQKQTAHTDQHIQPAKYKKNVQTNKQKQTTSTGPRIRPTTRKTNSDKQTKTIKVQFNNLAVAAKCSIQ